MDQQVSNQASQPPLAEANPNVLVTLTAASKVYVGAGQPFTALHALDLQIQTGTLVAILGKSGSGKSTLLNLLAGFDRTSSGEIVIAGQPLSRLKEKQIAPWRGRNVGMVFQAFHLLQTLTALENVLLAMDFVQRWPYPERRERALMLLAQLDVADQAHKLPATLSGGQQQRVAIARALANAPALLLADEPTGNLDCENAERIITLLRGLVRQGQTVLMVSHDSSLALHADRCLELRDGRLVADRQIVHAH